MSQPFFLARYKYIPNAAERTAMGIAMAMPKVITEMLLLEESLFEDAVSDNVFCELAGFVDVDVDEEAEEGRERAASV